MFTSLLFRFLYLVNVTCRFRSDYLFVNTPTGSSSAGQFQLIFPRTLVAIAGKDCGFHRDVVA
jgi:hypothetical protein